jgi:hypothetical protein
MDGKAELGYWRNRWDLMACVEYLIILGENARKRHFHEIQRGAVIVFMVQLEVRLEGNWLPVVRYDSKHGFAHMDRHRRSGETRKQLLLLPFAEALTFADADIREHWRDYQLRFMRGEWP